MNSPFQNTLGTNFVPSDQECQRIRDFLEHAQKEVADLTEELARLDSLRKVLSQRRQQLEEFIDIHLALVSPVRRLPEDIIRAIFVASLPTLRNPVISSEEAPLLLCQICRSWRRIALTTPRIWAAIHIVVPDQSQLQRLMDRVAIWFERSGVVPLEISVALSKTCLTIDISPLYSALVTVSRRWKSLEIPLSDDGSPVLSLTSENVPLLEVVKISQRDPPLEPPDCTSLLFLATRSLRSLTIPGSPNFQETSVSWKSLTHLNITPSRNRRLTTAVALAILRQSTNLQTCHFVITDVEGEGFVPGEHFSLPQLSHFSVRRNGVLPRDHSLGNITLPNLQSLDYFSNSGYADSNLAQLLPSTPSLEWFKIQIGGLRSDTLLDALSHMPTLKRLTILDEPANTDDWFLPRDERFLEHLTLSQGPEPDCVVCPCLEAIELYNFNALSDVTLLQFVRSRTEPQHQDVACLSRVFVQFNRCIEFDIQLHLQDAITGGLVMDLNYVKPRFTYSPFEGTNDWNPWR